MHTSKAILLFIAPLAACTTLPPQPVTVAASAMLAGPEGIDGVPSEIAEPSASTTGGTSTDGTTGGTTGGATQADAGADSGSFFSPFPVGQCSPNLTLCGFVDSNVSVCCNGKSDCAADGKSCKSSGAQCGSDSIKCGLICCAATLACDWTKDQKSQCAQMHCDAKQVECPDGKGNLTCCAEGEQCSVKPGETKGTCAKPTSPSRCKEPQFPCSVAGGLATDPAPKTACCNPGMVCSTTDDKAACCPPGMALSADGTGCQPLGEKCGQRTCKAGQFCCPLREPGAKKDDVVCTAGRDKDDACSGRSSRVDDAGIGTVTPPISR